MFISCFQLIFISSPRYLLKTTHSLYKNNLTLFSFFFFAIELPIHEHLWYKLQIKLFNQIGMNWVLSYYFSYNHRWPLPKFGC
jgi:hypothetical protein